MPKYTKDTAENDENTLLNVIYSEITASPYMMDLFRLLVTTRTGRTMHPNRKYLN
jgi:hypothetical protein